MARPICFRLFTHCARRAASRAACTAGNSSAINTAMMAMTTSSSMSVNPRRLIEASGLSQGDPESGVIPPTRRPESRERLPDHKRSISDDLRTDGGRLRLTLGVRRANLKIQICRALLHEGLAGL